MPFAHMRVHMHVHMAVIAADLDLPSASCAVPAAFALQLLPFFPSPWCVLPVELLHGLTFGMGG